MRIRVLALVMLVLAFVPRLAFAQSPSVEWNRWDAQITVRDNDQLQIAETQEINITNGVVHRGQRDWSSNVDVQSVFLIVNNGTPQQLTQSSSAQPNTYQVTTSGGQTTLVYQLPQAQEAGSFIVQINYAATSPTTGLVDWKIVPANHGFAVRSSTVRITFPEGQAPDPSLVRATSDADISANGNVVEIHTNAPIPASQSFGIQVPYGDGVGVPAGNGNTGNSGNPNPISPVNPGTSPNTPTVELPGSSLLFFLCIIGIMMFFGGGTLLRSLLGGLLGGGSSLGGSRNQPGSGFGPFAGGNNPFGSGQSSTSSRGFRRSSDQDRSVGGNIGNDKDSGGGASFS